MTATLTLPETAPQRMPRTVSLPLTSRPALDQEARRTLPPAIADALEGVAQQTRGEILQPLLYAPSPQALVETFVALYPRYWGHHVSAALLLAAAVGGDLRRLFALTTRALQDAEEALREHAPSWLGLDAATAALFGLETMRRAARGIVTAPHTKLAQSDQDQWTNNVIAHSMAGLAVLFAIRDEPAHARPENVRALAYWSRGYALNVYRIARRLGLLAPRALEDPLPPGDEEDLLLANTGLDDYCHMLAEEERGGSPEG